MQIGKKKLGAVLEVDVGDSGMNKHDFFRIRVELSVKKALKVLMLSGLINVEN